MDFSKELKRNIRKGPLSGIMQERDGFDPFSEVSTSKESARFTEESYSIRDIILSQTDGRDISKEREISAVIEKDMHRNLRMRGVGAEPAGLYIPWSVLNRGADNIQTRALTAGGNAGAEMIQTKVHDEVFSGLYPFSGLLLNGATVLNLRSNFAAAVVQPQPLTVSGGLAPSGVAEVTTVVENTQPLQFAQVTMPSPTRLNTSVQVSRQLMVQSQPDFERFIAKEIRMAIASGIDGAVIRGGTGLPTGILGTTANANTGNNVLLTAPSVTWGGAATRANQSKHVKALQALNHHDDGSFAWFISPSAADRWRNISQSGTYPRWLLEENGTACGYRAFVTNNLASSIGGGEQSLFVKCSEVLIGLFGGIDVLVDPVSFSYSGQIVLHINVLFSYTMRHFSAACYSTDSAAQ
jgi:HK97 family phage major capsid protein